MQPSYELFDHTADIGFRVRAATLSGLLQPAGEALYTVIGEFAPGGEPKPVTFELAGAKPPLLLRDYLGELLILFERKHRWAASVHVAEFSDSRLNATVQAVLADPKRSVFHREVKAITYHELDIRTIPGGYEATIIVDI